MVRLHTSRRSADRELIAFIVERCKAYALSGNYCMAADYTLRWLDREPTNADALALGSVLGRVVGQPTLSDKCVGVLNMPVSVGGISVRCNGAVGGVARRVTDTTVKGAPIPNMWTKVSPTTASLVRGISFSAGEPAPEFEHIESKPGDVSEMPMNLPPPGIETLALGSNLDIPVIQSLLREASWATTTGGMQIPVSPSYECPISVLSPEGSAYGRGIFAASPLKTGDTLLDEEAVLSVTSHTSSSSLLHSGDVTAPFSICFHCGEQIGAIAVRCSQQCASVSYCSSSCEEQALGAFHASTCEAKNPSFCHWEGQIVEDCRRPLGDAYKELLAIAPSQSKGGVRPLMTVPEVQRETGESIRAHIRHAHSALTMIGVGRLCAIAATEGKHPLSVPALALLSGKTEYSTEATLIHTGALAVGLSSALSQPHLYLDDLVSLYALLQTNGFYNTLMYPGGLVATLHLFPMLSLLNHSCLPNCRLERYNVNTPSSGSTDFGSGQRLVAMRDVRPGEQLYINYNDGLITPSASYSVRKELLEQRGFACTCDRCLLRK